MITAAHAMLSQPPQAVCDFAFAFVDQLEQSLRRRASGDTIPIVIEMELELSVDDNAVKEFRRALRRLT